MLPQLTLSASSSQAPWEHRVRSLISLSSAICSTLMTSTPPVKPFGNYAARHDRTCIRPGQRLDRCWLKGVSERLQYLSGMPELDSMDVLQALQLPGGFMDGG